jgi:hypothetical protein
VVVVAGQSLVLRRAMTVVRATPGADADASRALLRRGSAVAGWSRLLRRGMAVVRVTPRELAGARGVLSYGGCCVWPDPSPALGRGGV